MKTKTEKERKRGEREWDVEIKDNRDVKSNSALCFGCTVKACVEINLIISLFCCEAALSKHVTAELVHSI